MQVRTSPGKACAACFLLDDIVGEADKGADKGAGKGADREAGKGADREADIMEADRGVDKDGSRGGERPGNALALAPARAAQGPYAGDGGLDLARTRWQRLLDFVALNTSSSSLRAFCARPATVDGAVDGRSGTLMTLLDALKKAFDGVGGGCG